MSAVWPLLELGDERKHMHTICRNESVCRRGCSEGKGKSSETSVIPLHAVNSTGLQSSFCCVFLFYKMYLKVQPLVAIMLHPDLWAKLPASITKNRPFSTKSFAHPQPEGPWALPLAFCAPLTRGHRCRPNQEPTPRFLHVMLFFAFLPRVHLSLLCALCWPLFPPGASPVHSKWLQVSCPSFIWETKSYLMTWWSLYSMTLKSVFLLQFLNYTAVQVSTSISKWPCHHHKHCLPKQKPRSPFFLQRPD